MAYKLRRVKKVLLKHFQIVMEKVKKGRHPFKFVRDPINPFPVPAHNGLKSDLTDVYIRAIANHFGLDETALWQALQGIDPDLDDDSDDDAGSPPTGTSVPPPSRQLN